MTIKHGDRVAIDYEGRFEDGTVFDSSSHGDHSHALIFTVGAHEVIAGFENGVIGLAQGEEKEITIVPADAYGERDDRLVRDVPKDEIKLPRNQEPKAGMALMTYTPEGQPIQIFVKDVTKDSIVLDLNHPLAGKTLIFKIKVVSINDTIKEDSYQHHMEKE